MDDDQYNLTPEDKKFLKEQIADQRALKRTLGRLQKYVLWIGAAIGGYAILGEKLPELLKKWIG